MVIFERYPRVITYDPGCYKEHKSFITKELLNKLIREGFAVDFSLESPEDRMMQLENKDKNTMKFTVIINPKDDNTKGAKVFKQTGYK